jgi:hypothetical protein
MSEEPKKPGVAFWATVVVIAVPALYVASAGSLVWLKSHGFMSEAAWNAAMVVYYPIDRLTPEPFGSWIGWYVDLWR